MTVPVSHHLDHSLLLFFPARRLFDISNPEQTIDDRILDAKAPEPFERFRQSNVSDSTDEIESPTSSAYELLPYRPSYLLALELRLSGGKGVGETRTRIQDALRLNTCLL